MATHIKYVSQENTDREYPDAFVVEEAMFKVNGEYVCVEPCGGGGHVRGDQHIYISLSGNDQSGNGSEEFPFRTIHKALDYINTIVALEGDIFVHFMDEGPYYIDVYADRAIIINHQNIITFIGFDFIPPPLPKIALFAGGFYAYGTGAGELRKDKGILKFDYDNGVYVIEYGELSSNRSRLSSCGNNEEAFFFAGGSLDGTENCCTSTYRTVCDYKEFASDGNAVQFGNILQGDQFLEYVSSASMMNDEAYIVGGGSDSSGAWLHMLDMATRTISECTGTFGENGNGQGKAACGTSSDADCCYFAGGGIRNDNANIQTDDIYKIISCNTTTITIIGQLTTYKMFMGGATARVMNLGVFSGGLRYDGYNLVLANEIEILDFSTEGNTSIWGHLTTAKHKHSSTSNGDIILFGGGTEYIDIFDGYYHSCCNSTLNESFTSIDKLDMTSFTNTDDFGNLINGITSGTAVSTLG
jgi:hypothetical protein